jgi:hypothetical protein
MSLYHKDASNHRMFSAVDFAGSLLFLSSNLRGIHGMKMNERIDKLAFYLYKNEVML